MTGSWENNGREGDGRMDALAREWGVGIYYSSGGAVPSDSKVRV